MFEVKKHFAALVIVSGIVLLASGTLQRQRVAASSSEVLAGPKGETSEEESSFRILLGLTDTHSTNWNGSLAVSPGSLMRLEPWRLDYHDHVAESSWNLLTRSAGAGIVANGVVATFRNLSPSSTVRVQTVQGDFEFWPYKLTYGSEATLLGGRVRVDRIPPTMQITTGPTEHDFPAMAADQRGNVCVAYLEFVPNPKFAGIRLSTPAPFTNFSELAEPTGGDQILLTCYSRGGWSEPIPISPPHGDLFRPAIGIDGSGKIWVVWSANEGGNFDLYARSVDNGRPGKTLRLTTDSGSDICPVAATDSEGRIWIAWQAFRNGHAQIHAMHQEGSGYSTEITLASSISNEWNPAIAASPEGEVCVAWDTYRNGSYDVYFRTVNDDGRLGPEIAGAASARYEAYPSIAYDRTGRLWIAWEESGEGWGKDWGLYQTTGIPIYQGRWIKLRVWANNQLFSVDDPGKILPGVPDYRVDSTSRQSDPQYGTQPDPSLAMLRKPSQQLAFPPRPQNSYPRLLCGPDGRIWLAYRTAQPTWSSAIGGVWFENVVSFDGNVWSAPIFLMHSDNLLDNRPALASTAPGELTVVGSADGRQQFAPLRQVFDKSASLHQPMSSPTDPYHNELYSSQIVLPGQMQGVKLRPSPAELDRPADESEADMVHRMRQYRIALGGDEYQILRGEFHRHTAIDDDGWRDGAMWDTWRYALDVAALDWIGCCNHDNGDGREYTWWMNQKLDDMFLLPGRFTPVFSYERSVNYPEGHRNILMAQRGVRTLPRLPKVGADTTGHAPDTRMLYSYLKFFHGIAASHTSATVMGTDWRDNDPEVEPIVEIYQGITQSYEMPDAPRSVSADDQVAEYYPKGFISLALEKGYWLGFEASSDHISTHMSYAILTPKEAHAKTSSTA